MAIDCQMDNLTSNIIYDKKSDGHYGDKMGKLVSTILFRNQKIGLDYIQAVTSSWNIYITNITG